MAVPGDILRLKSFGSYLGQSFLNVWFYEVNTVTNGTVNLFRMAQAWGNGFGSSVLPSLSTSLSVNRIVIDNLTDGLEFADIGVVLPGGAAGDNAPSSLAFGVDLIRTTKITRQGYKRFPGVPEGTVSGNVQSIPAAQVTAIEDFCDASLFLQDYDTLGNDLLLNHVIVGRTKNAQDVYELDLTKINPVSSAQVRAFVSTQNTRKP